MSQIARNGDTSTHGGAIVGASSHMNCRGSIVALDGDMLMCPKHGPKPISANSHFRMNGKKVVIVGNQASCGATIVSGAGGTELT